VALAPVGLALERIDNALDMVYGAYQFVETLH
jgi:hypothetical protein